MTMRISNVLRGARNKFMLRRPAALAGGLAVMGLAFAGTQAQARPVQFRYVGGRWSHSQRAGWHRYWGGPSVGFYYAPSPVYVVAGYSAPSYYSGPGFWTSNPAFGITLNFGGGGYYDGGRYYRSDHYSGNHYYGGDHHYSGHYSGGGHYSSNSNHYSDGHYSGGRSAGGGHSAGGEHGRR